MGSVPGVSPNCSFLFTRTQTINGVPTPVDIFACNPIPRSGSFPSGCVSSNVSWVTEASAVTLEEGSSVTFVVSPNGGAVANGDVLVETVDGTAVAGVDYVAISQTIDAEAFAIGLGPGTCVRGGVNVTVQTIERAGAQADRSFTLRLTQQGPTTVVDEITIVVTDASVFTGTDLLLDPIFAGLTDIQPEESVSNILLDPLIAFLNQNIRMEWWSTLIGGVIGPGPCLSNFGCGNDFFNDDPSLIQSAPLRFQVADV